MIRIGYLGPPHPVLGLVAMLEDADYEVTYDPPDLSAAAPVSVDLWVTDIQLNGESGVQAVVHEFEDRHPGLPLDIRVQT
jgi:hypothetical protein